jgi:hypothetical protein
MTRDGRCLLNCDDDDEERQKDPAQVNILKISRLCIIFKEFGPKVAVDNSHITMYNGVR